MRIIVTGDLQADWDNLHLCEQAWVQVMEYAQLRKMDAIVVVGDLKRVYSPVDLRITNWWVSAISRATKQYGIPVIVDLGNHDRAGQYTDAVNWFPVMRKAGAICVDKGPKVIEVGDGQLAMLPFCSNKKLLKQWAQDLHQWVSKDAVLIFHEDIKGCRYNQLGRKSEVGIEPEDLYPHSYRYCIGGHIHLHQKIGENIYYTGSPFCQDWGESNQAKGFMVLSETGVKFLPSSIPGWYDPSWPGFNEPGDWNGARVRIHVRCRDGVDYLHRIEQARIRAERKYQGAEIYVCPDFEESGKTETVSIGFNDPDEDKIRAYVKETCPENLNGEKAAAYLIKHVAEVSGRWVRTGLGVEFLWAKGKNFLGYKDVSIRLNKPGLFTVMGKNYDRGGLSNGAGKTSILQTIPVPLFGMTFKGQKHDRWARRNSEEKAFVVLALRDSQNRIIKIRRTRRPSGLQLWIDGEDQSAGMKPQDKDGTQGQIEKVTGFTWQTLANAVYIDQTVARAFLAGRQSDRTAVLSRFQNLERFEKALKGVREARRGLNGLLEGQKRDLAVLQERIAGYERTLSLLVVESKERVQEAWDVAELAKKTKQDTEQRISPILDRHKAKAKVITSRYDAATTVEATIRKSINMLAERITIRRKEADKLINAASYRECPTCHQEVDARQLKKSAAVIGEMVKAISKKLGQLSVKHTEAVQNVITFEGEHDEAMMKLAPLERELAEVLLAYQHAEKQYKEIKRREHDSIGRSDLKVKLKEGREKEAELKAEAEKYNRRDDMYAYCDQALSREGIPAFLNALLCGPLNVAAEFYSETFCGKAVQVRFEMENGEFVPQIINATGGEEMGDQSDGEKALAGLIASFALREVAPKCNILVLDEPALGLDAIASRQFAIGLKALKEKFKTILITTHNVHILQELGDEQSIMVTKKNGISRVAA